MPISPIVHQGRVVSIDHLAPFDFPCPCPDVGRDLVVRVGFLNHCYTCAFDARFHERSQIVLFDAPGRARVFDPLRYELSHRLPDIIAGLPGRRVNQTTASRNYVYAVPMEIAGVIYEVFFQLQRHGREGCDLRLTVESAYPSKHAIPMPKRPNAIRFNVLVHKVFARKPVRFAAR